MSSSFRIRTLRRFSSLVLLAALPLATPSVAQETGADVKPGATKAAVALGEKLFNDTPLSSTGSMSCASCHRPDRSFTEDKPHAIGQSGTELGRNTPTLIGLASVKEFPVGGSFSAPPRMVSLEERVLNPLRDLTEMGLTVATAAERLSKDPASAKAFDDVFEEPGNDHEPPEVTGDRMATALAAYVRSIRPPETTSLLALTGSNVSLEASVGRGLDLFREEGKCQSCHSGPGMTDGQMHVVSRLSARNMFARPGFQTPVRAKELDVSVNKDATDTRPASTPHRGLNAAFGSGRYGQSMALERQTLTLLDVKRTGPYFRDGSVAVLSDAVRHHVSELREIGSRRAAILENPHSLLAEANVVVKTVGTTPARSLSASAKEQLSSDTWIPPELTSQQLDDLVSFLASLSPTD